MKTIVENLTIRWLSIGSLIVLTMLTIVLSVVTR